MQLYIYIYIHISIYLNLCISCVRSPGTVEGSLNHKFEVWAPNLSPEVLAPCLGGVCGMGTWYTVGL